MGKLEFFKKYCKIKNIENKYAFGKIDGDKKMLVFLNGEISEHLEYQGNNLKDGVLYRVSPATCGYGEDGSNKCNIGNPNKQCIGSVYSKNKCAVYFHYFIDIETFKYELSIEDFALLQAE